MQRENPEQEVRRKRQKDEKCKKAREALESHRRNNPDDHHSNTLRKLLLAEAELCLDGIDMHRRNRQRPPPLFAFVKKTGSKEEVWHGTCKQTSGGLTKQDLMVNKAGKVVSRRKSELARKNNYLQLNF